MTPPSRRDAAPSIRARALETFPILLVAALVASCGGQDPIQAPALSSGRADFSRLAIVGDSFSAGLQSNGLTESRQVRSFAYLFARQAEQAPDRFEIPKVAAPGVPALLQIQSLSPLRIVQPEDPGAPGNYAARFTNSALPRPYNNLAVPGATAALALTTTIAGDPRQSAFALYAPAILRLQAIPASMIDQAASLDPTFALVELGINDVMNGIANGQPGLMTPLEGFVASYTEVLDRLGQAGQDGRRPDIVLVNVPTPTAYPFLTTVPWFLVNPNTNQPVLTTAGELIPLLGIVGGQARPLPPGSLVTLGAASLLAQGIGVPASVGGTGQPLPDSVVLDNEAELAAARQRVDAMNAFIEQIGRSRGYPILDLNTLLLDRGEGMLIGGIEFSKSFVTGGFFSLDGIHPANLGHAVAANALIGLVNQSYGSTIPFVNLNDDLKLRTEGSVSPALSAVVTAATWRFFTPVDGIANPEEIKPLP